MKFYQIASMYSHLTVSDMDDLEMCFRERYDNELTETEVFETEAEAIATFAEMERGYYIPCGNEDGYCRIEFAYYEMYSLEAESFEDAEEYYGLGDHLVADKDYSNFAELFAEMSDEDKAMINGEDEDDEEDGNE